MKLKSVLACVIIVAAFPLLASTTENNIVQFASIAFAEHLIAGNYYCECGSDAAENLSNSMDM